MSNNPGPITNLSQEEKAETLKNNTMLRRAQSEFDLENTGRHSKSATVIGTGAPNYPRLPENNWTNDPVPPEPVLGIDVNATEPVGEYGEVTASIERLERTAQEASAIPTDVAARGAGAVPSNTTASSAPANRIRRRL
jgi:hypothetical protein